MLSGGNRKVSVMLSEKAAASMTSEHQIRVDHLHERNAAAGDKNPATGINPNQESPGPKELTEQGEN